jgi:hypothetical protein
MAVKWIGDAAHELGLSPLDAVEILASRQEYAFNGLVDEDRFKTLRLMRSGKRLESSGSMPVPAAAAHAEPATVPIGSAAPAAHLPPPPPPAPVPAPKTVLPAPPPVRPAVGEATSVTTPLQTIPGPHGERTVILPPVDPKR